MEWVKEFYEKQNQWMNYSKKPVDDYDFEKVELVEKCFQKDKLTILELGSGGGQFSIAAAQKGHEVVAIELNKTMHDNSVRLAKENNLENIEFINDDFYNVDFKKYFDAIVYWDGFGIGEDEDQIRLLEKYSEFLNNNGKFLIDIYTPWFWSYASGQSMEFDSFKRIYVYDAYNNRMIDKWFSKNDEDDFVTQSLRCYSPADLNLLIKNSKLRIEEVVPGSSFNYEENEFISKSSLERAMTYTAIISNKK